MKTHRTALAACGAAMLVLAMSGSGQADSSRTYLTFSGPVALPGVNLAGGTYIFEQLGSSLELVRVSSRDGRQVYLTAFTLPVHRPRGLGPDAQIIFGESAVGGAPVIGTWFPPGERDGREFMYR